MGKFLARFLAGFGEGDYGGRRREEVEEFQLPKVILKVPETGESVPKVLFLAEWGDFWHFGEVFGRLQL